jgi:glycosyltransferase involved in cell wall biosynthesis
MTVPRVALFADAFHEVNGVARTCRQFARFAQERNYPFFSIHAGPLTRHTLEKNFETFEIRNSRLRMRLETDLFFDLLFLRHWRRVARALRRFQPDLIHITGPSHIGLLGALLSLELKVPLVASWHTNLHEYAAGRLARSLSRFPPSMQARSAEVAGRWSLTILVQFYRLARVLFAPNPELIALLASRTGRPTFPMYRGIDTSLFSAERRERSNDTFVIGYVGRLSTEKNVRLLAQVEQALIARGVSDYEFLIVGEGSERPWLEANMTRARLTGVLLGVELARAYASMDAFVFPSATDTFGNVVLEALASGVPTLVSSQGGPKYLISQGTTGFVAHNVEDYARSLKLLCDSPALREEMSSNARRSAATFSWDAVFDRVYQTYEEAFASGLLRKPARDGARDSRNRRAIRVLKSRA